ncbi:MAG: hypothetical protein ACRBN8_09195 [Nannocystales bacterium]
MNDPNIVPEPIVKLIDVFEAQLPEVEFPGVNAATLREQATTVDAAAETLAAAEVALREARTQHAEAYGALRTAAERGLGYAQVYATDNTELAEALAGIELRPAKPRRTPPKKRARKPKPTPDNVAELPLQAETA